MSKKSNSLSAGRPSVGKDQATLLASLADNAGKKRMNIDLSIEEHTKLKVYASSQGKSIKEVVTACIRQLFE